MATNRALVAVSANDTWLFMVFKGQWVEHEAEQVSPELHHIDGFTALPQGLSVVDFSLNYRPQPPDDCDVTAVNITSRRPTPEEVAALDADGPEVLRALWSDITEKQG